MNVNDMLIVGGYLVMTVLTFFIFMKFFIKMDDDGDGSTFWDEDSMVIGMFILIALFLAIFWFVFLWAFPIMGFIWLVGETTKKMTAKSPVASES
jgi:hypothetical protein